MTLTDFTAARYPCTSLAGSITTGAQQQSFMSGAELGMAFAIWTNKQGMEYDSEKDAWCQFFDIGEDDTVYTTTTALFETYLDTLKQNG